MSQNKDTSQSQRTRYLKDRVNYAGYLVNQALVAEGQSQFPLPIEGSTAALTPHQNIVANLRAGAVFTTAAEYNALLLSTYKVPSAPTGIIVSNSITDGEVNVSWTAPAFTGFTPIIQYIISSNPATTPITVSNLENSVLYTGLTTAVSYTFTVAAINIVGTGVASSPSRVIAPSSLSVTFFLVAGGGGGGTGNGGGGGGAGGVLSGTVAIKQTATLYTINVGATLTSGTKQDLQDGYPGGNTTFSGTGVTTQTAIGGGAGQGWNVNIARTTGTATGGSGGGGGGGGSSKTLPGGAGTEGQGYAGGKSAPYIDASSRYCGGGGGGAGGIGGDGKNSPTQVSGAGGIGTSAYSALFSTITAAGVSVGIKSGVTYYIGGGGGGCGLTNFSPGAGGLGGGASGTANNFATASTGGGGGAQGLSASNGGSGLAIMYYTSPTQLGTGGTVTSSGTGDMKIWYHVFKTTGANTFTF